MNQLALLPSPDQFTQIKEIANMAVKSGLLPSSIKTPEAAAIIALKGFELGLPPMVAFSHINVIQGKPTMSAEIMLAYIWKDHPNAVINFVEMTEDKCVIEAARKQGASLTKFIWDVERARKMGLLDKDNWKKQRGTMLKWRCITDMKRTLFSEVLQGIDYTPEELEDSRDVTPSPREAQPAVAEQTAPVRSIKNYAPQTAEDAKNWKPEATKQSNPVENPATQPSQRDELVASVREAASVLNFSGSDVTDLVKTRYQKTTTELSVDELQDLSAYLWDVVKVQKEGVANG